MKCKTMLFILLMLIFFQNVSAVPKILLIVEANCLQSIPLSINSYCNSIVNVDHKHVEVIGWTNPEGYMLDQCLALRSRLQQEYFEAENAGDVLEGAVLIGDICLPLSATRDNYSLSPFFPMDHFFMDIVDKRASPAIAYTSAGIPFPTTDISPGWSFFNGTYKSGDDLYDIWISRVNAAYLPTLREGNTIKDEYLIYTDYLSRVINRMNNPAKVTEVSDMELWDRMLV